MCVKKAPEIKCGDVEKQGGEKFEKVVVVVVVVWIAKEECFFFWKLVIS